MKDKNIVNLTTSKDFVKDIAQTISSWLIYNTSVSGTVGIQENMIDYPIKAFLVCHQKEWDKATFEESHPYLSNRRIDFSFTQSNTNYYFEFKQAKEETNNYSEFQRVYNDLIRLSICKKQDNNNRCFFLMFGDLQTYKESFVSGKYKRFSYSNCFSFYADEVNNETIIFPKEYSLTKTCLSGRKNKLYKTFLSKYKDSAKAKNYDIEELIPEKITTKLIWTNYYTKDDKETSITDVVGVWEIMLEPSIIKISDLDYSEQEWKHFLDASTGLTN